MPNENKFLQLVNNSFKSRLFLLSNLPAAYFSGVRVKHADEASCTVIVPFKWFSKNPFRSTYFACLGMAGELSTGILAMAHCYQSDPAVSMLVRNMEASFTKKATGITTFTCNDGEAIKNIVAKAKQSGEGETLRVKSTGVNDAGEVVAEFYITWGFKVKSLKDKG
jgi:hypothetical protein